MLKNVDKSLFSITVIYLLIGCNLGKKDALIKRTVLYESFSKRNLSENEYTKIYKSASDSINLWTERDLKSYLDCKLYDYRIDSLICVNSDRSKCVMTLLFRVDIESSVGDGLDFFYGVKLHEQWYFFRGPSIHLPREYYQKDIHTPLSWEKLHELAMTEIFSGYLRRDAAGQWQINDHFFDDIIPKNEPVARGYGECFECNTEEEYVLYRVRKNWRERDTISQVLAQPPL